MDCREDLQKAARSLAEVGVSDTFGKWGNRLLTNILVGGYEGEVYLVNVKGGEMLGRKIYTSVTEIPGEVDLAVVVVPAAHVRALLPGFKAKGITRMLLITSGFGELGPEGKALEDELVKEARQAGVMILGPNTMGICTPSEKFHCTGTVCAPEPGSVGLISQSGNLGIQLMSFAEMEGLGIRAFCGSGNEAMVTIEDYLHSMANDTLAKTVVLKIESIKDGPRFFATAQRASRKKPVIALKGGRTEAGSRAAASHTGALAANSKVFDAACRQAGVVLVEHPLDLLDLAAAFSCLPLPRGK